MKIDREQKSKILKIARAARNAAEELVSCGYKGPVYKSNDLTLGGACGDVSQVILDTVRTHVGAGILTMCAGGFDGQSHYWLKFNDTCGCVKFLDATVTQFDDSLPRVYVSRDDRYMLEDEGSWIEPRFHPSDLYVSEDEYLWRLMLYTLVEARLRGARERKP